VSTDNPFSWDLKKKVKAVGTTGGQRVNQVNDKDKLERLWAIREDAMKDMYASECRFNWDEDTRDRFSAALQAFMEADFTYIAEFNKQTEDTDEH
tara:strand:+ start:468 stop:752 length:285 start_codon:yes stop_codon:yes gene_type:complete